MKTEEYILNKNINIDVNKIAIPTFKNTEKHLINEYIEFTRHFQEIDQLFHILKVNLDHLLIHYELMNNDIIIKKDNFSVDENDGIIINALVINYISAARTFVESVEIFLKERLGEEALQKFKTTNLSKIYDERFSYRLLYNLRNFSQHGHLPVYIEANNKCSFDLEQILYTPHFEHNKKLKKEMESIKEKILKEFEDNPRIMFTRTLAEFQIAILEIYVDFINFIFDNLVFYKKEIEKLIDTKPNIVYKSKDIFNGFIMYEVKDNNIHCFDPNQNPIEMVENIKENLLNDLKKNKEEFNKIFKMRIKKAVHYKK